MSPTSKKNPAVKPLASQSSLAMVIIVMYPGIMKLAMSLLDSGMKYITHNMVCKGKDGIKIRVQIMQS
jgi:hypothetical protein